MDNIYVKNATSVIVQVLLRDTGSATAGGKTGLTYSSPISAYYCRPGGTSNAINFISGSAGDSYSSGKFAEIDPVGMPGFYQVHLPNDCLVSGANSVVVCYTGTNIFEAQQKIILNDADLRNSNNLGLTYIGGVVALSATTAQQSTVISLSASDFNSLQKTSLNNASPLINQVVLSGSQPYYTPSLQSTLLSLSGNTLNAQLVAISAGVDFNAIMKTSLNQATPSVTIPAVVLSASQPNYAPVTVQQIAVISASDFNAIQKTTLNTIVSGTSVTLSANQPYYAPALQTTLIGLSANTLNAQIVSISAGVDFNAKMKTSLNQATPTISGNVTSNPVVLSASQPFYAPALSGQQMDLINAPNSVAISAIQDGLLKLTTTVDGVALSYVYQLMASMMNGNFSYNPLTNRVTFFMRDGITPLTVLYIPDDNTRTRIS